MRSELVLEGVEGDLDWALDSVICNLRVAAYGGPRREATAGLHEFERRGSGRVAAPRAAARGARGERASTMQRAWQRCRRASLLTPLAQKIGSPLGTEAGTTSDRSAFRAVSALRNSTIASTSRSLGVCTSGSRWYST